MEAYQRLEVNGGLILKSQKEGECVCVYVCVCVSHAVNIYWYVCVVCLRLRVCACLCNEDKEEMRCQRENVNGLLTLCNLRPQFT